MRHRIVNDTFAESPLILHLDTFYWNSGDDGESETGMFFSQPWTQFKIPCFRGTQTNVNCHRSVRGNYLRYCSTDIITNFYLKTLFFFVMFVSVRANIIGDQCDWSGNGLSLSSSGQNRGVIPVYLRCSQGTVKWSYPRGALRVVLRLPNNGKDFKGCLRVSPNFAGAQLFLVGPRSLSRLFSINDGREKRLVRCFQSRNGQAAIYVEAVDTKGMFEREVAAFSYDLQPIPRGYSFFDLINNECRPCSRQEMARAFCTSDLVTRGLIYGIDDKQNLEIAEISVKVTEVLRHLNDDFSAMDDRRNSIEVDVEPFEPSRGTIIRMTIPRHCDPQQGPGEFVFMGRKRLGDLTLTCATSLSDWADIVRTMTADGTSHCVLKI